MDKNWREEEKEQRHQKVTSFADSQNTDIDQQSMAVSADERATLNDSLRRTGFQVPDKNKYRKLKILVDILSFVFFVTFFACAFYVYWGTKRYYIHGSPMPLELIIFLADLFPALFGLTWLAFRYADSWDRHLPSVLKAHARNFLVLLGIIYAISKFIWR